MEIQTHLKPGVLSTCRLRGFCLVGLMVLCGLPSHGEPQKLESSDPTPSVHRHHPVAFRKAADRPILHRAAQPTNAYKGIPRARVVRRAPAVRVPASGSRARPTPTQPVSHAKPVANKPLQKSRPTPKVAASMSPAPTPKSRPNTSAFPTSPSPATLVRRCDVMALQGLEYKFGSVDPASGGLDCSSTVQYLLRQEGINDCPRTAYTQYMWLKKSGTLHKVSRWTWSADRVAKKLRAGDLLFWTGTYNTGNSPNISHVMIYLGRDASNGKHYMFGASSRRSKGLHGNAVDVYEFVYPKKNGKDNFAGFGSVPGLRR